MIQRIQSIWLLLAAVFAAITFRFPFYNGDWLKDTVQAPVNLDATTTPWLTIVTAFVGALAFLTIFFYGNRKTQLRLTYLGILLTVVMLVLYFLELENLVLPYGPSSILPSLGSTTWQQGVSGRTRSLLKALTG
jgi:hypothetical protein